MDQSNLTKNLFEKTFQEKEDVVIDPLDPKNENYFFKEKVKNINPPNFYVNPENRFVECLKLKTWNSITPRDQLLNTIQHERIHLKTPFPRNDKINRKIALWVGDITKLDCQAIVHTTNENFKEDSILTRKIYEKAGYGMINYLKSDIKICKTGEVYVSNGFGLNSRYCFHTVGPKYKDKYQTAAESALFNCYHKVLNSMREYKVTTLALCPINTVKRSYPVQEAAHVGIRTLRRFLENHLDKIELIVFAVEDLDVGIYESIIPLYFPRSRNEEIYACYKLPRNIGGPNGEPILHERQIRIIDRPLSRYVSETNFKNDEEENCLEKSIDLVSGLESSVIVGKTSFAKMKTDVDKKWLIKNGLHNKYPERSISSAGINSKDNYNYEMNRKLKYNNLLRRAKAMNHTDSIKLRYLYINGVDRLGRTVVIIIGSHFRNDLISLERAFLYFIYIMDCIKDQEYTVLYFHSGTNEKNYVPISFLRHLYETVDSTYLQNLNAIYSIHPTLWFKMVSWWFTTFTAVNLKNKVISIKSLSELDTVLDIQDLKIPQSVLETDFKINGNRFLKENTPDNFF